MSLTNYTGFFMTWITEYKPSRKFETFLRLDKNLRLFKGLKNSFQILNFLRPCRNPVIQNISWVFSPNYLNIDIHHKQRHKNTLRWTYEKTSFLVLFWWPKYLNHCHLTVHFLVNYDHQNHLHPLNLFSWKSDVSCSWHHQN